MIEAMRLAFADTGWYVADPAFVPAPVEWLLSKEYADGRRKLIQPERASFNQIHGIPPSSDTVYLSAVDAEGNACSFINSNYDGFGTGIVPHGWGFTLQNRGSGFSLDPHHPNALAPGKRPYHTIIPAMITRDSGGTSVLPNTLYASFGVMGGFMQPQGHLQVVVALLDDQVDPQSALDRPRFRIYDASSGFKVAMEDGMPQETLTELSKLGHKLYTIEGYARSAFGRGQIILRDARSGALCGGSDPRADGCAMSL